MLYSEQLRADDDDDRSLSVTKVENTPKNFPPNQPNYKTLFVPYSVKHFIFIKRQDPGK